MNRRPSVSLIVIVGLLVGFLVPGLAQQEKKPNPFNTGIVGQAQKLYGLDFNEAERDSVLENLAPIHVAQTLSYLKATGYALALLINFNVPVLKDGIRRVVLT